jgi:hypothetical protein
LFLSSLFFSTPINAQLEKVIVETYYISDAKDSTNTIGGKLEAGSTTYRIYVDMKAGSKLSKIYGDVNHPIKIKSTTPFFNNSDRGVSFGKDMIVNRLTENTVALDTWLTVGQCTKSSSNTYFGVLKTEDNNGSIIGGSNNDGGSAVIAGGLLVNADPNAGIPLTTADGMDTLVNLPLNWGNNGILTAGVDYTIFGSEQINTQFVSYFAELSNSGVMGVDPLTNQVLIAQLTTKGTLSFELNLVITTANNKIIKYVANDSVMLEGEKLSHYLKYPFSLICNCPNPEYLEYSLERDCDNTDSCKTIATYGCMDTLACNYDAMANLNIQSLCCYPGLCNDRKLEVVCPTISNTFAFSLFPNPAQTQITIQISSGLTNNAIRYSIYDAYGVLKFEKNLGTFSGIVNEQIDLSGITNGLYLVYVTDGSTFESKLFTKN